MEPNTKENNADDEVDDILNVSFDSLGSKRGRPAI